MTNPTPKIETEKRLRWVPIAQMKLNPLAQRQLKQYHVDHLVANLNLEELGTPTVNRRDGSWYIIDGQHRIEALRAIGWGDQQIECWTYEGLTSEDEAAKFRTLNKRLTVASLDDFRIAVHAGDPVDSDIDRIVRAQGLVVSLDNVPGAIGGVGTLRRVYLRSDGKTLGRALRIDRDAYGDPGMQAAVIDGLGYLCQRYNGSLNDDEAVKKLAAAHGGVNGLLGKAEQLHKRMGTAKGQCVAAAAVETINRGRGGKKLPDWWKADA